MTLQDFKYADVAFNLYDQIGSLNHDGKSTFWQEVNNQLRRFKRLEIDLKPISKE